MEEHTQRMRRRVARPQFFMRRHDCMMHGKAMSSLRLGTLGARPPSQSPQLAAKESTMEKLRKSKGEERRGEALVHGCS